MFFDRFEETYTILRFSAINFLFRILHQVERGSDKKSKYNTFQPNAQAYCCHRLYRSISLLHVWT